MRFGGTMNVRLWRLRRDQVAGHLKGAVRRQYRPSRSPSPLLGIITTSSRKDGLSGAFEIDEELETTFIGEPDHLK